jgi:hypothetical protein
MLSQLELLDEAQWERRSVSVAEFHKHYLESYNEAVKPVETAAPVA